MPNELKQSSLINWWVAPSNDEKMQFFNILHNLGCNKEQLRIIGCPRDNSGNDIYYDDNRIVEITNQGLTTSNGTLYRYDEAHGLYLIFYCWLQSLIPL